MVVADCTVAVGRLDTMRSGSGESEIMSMSELLKEAK